MGDYKNVFSYYYGGIKHGELYFLNGEIKAKKINPKNLSLEPIEKIEENDTFFIMPIHSILKHLDEYSKVNWLQDSIIFEWGDKYNKYKSVTGVYGGVKCVAQYWAQRDKKMPIDIITIGTEIIGFIFITRPDIYILVKPGYEDFTPLNQWNDESISKPIYGIDHKGTYMIPMKDGTLLATEVWLPNNNNDEKFPAILLRTPYNRFKIAKESMRFVHRGYALISQDARGRDDSEGEWNPQHNEIEDGDETLNWIASQDWSNSKVGMIGASYGGYVQWTAASLGNPYLKAIVSVVTAGGPFVDLPRPGGLFMSGMLAWSFAMSEKTVNPKLMIRDDWNSLLKTRPIIDIAKKGLGKEVPFIKRWMEEDIYNDFWAKDDWATYGKNIDVPALFISGWYDDDGRGTTQAWEMYKENNREKVKMILGPWYHNANTTRDIHNVHFGDNAIRYDLGIQHIKWFDRFLKDIDNKVDKGDKVEYYVVGDNIWSSSDTWPPKEIKLVEYYLSSKGSANSSNGDGILTNEPQADSYDTYMFDPQNATPFLIDVSENENSVPENYKEVELRNDVLVYTSDILQEDTFIAGYVYADFYASSSCKDTDWVVRLTDVDEENNSIRLTDGMIRAKFRNSFKKIELLEPEKIEKYRIELRHIANVFKKGHRIRVEITSGAENLAFPNHNTGNHPAYDTDYVVAKQKIYHGEGFPSCIKLPIIKANIV